MPDDEAKSVAAMLGKVREHLSDFLALDDEIQLKDYGETASGPYLSMRLFDHEILRAFRGQQRATRTTPGRIYRIMMIEIDDDGTPINQRRRNAMELAAQCSALNSRLREVTPELLEELAEYPKIALALGLKKGGSQAAYTVGAALNALQEKKGDRAIFELMERAGVK